LTIPAVEDVLFGLGRLSIDPVGGTYGATAVAKQFYGFKLTIEAHWRPLPTGDLTLGYAQAAYAGHTITGEVTFLHDAAVAGVGSEKEAWRAQTPRRLQLRFDGSTLTTAGTAHSKKTLIANLPIKWKTFGPLADSDDINIVTGQFFSKYNATVGDAGNIVIAGHQAAIERACEAAKAKGAKRALPLPVSAPFHSSLLKPASDRLREHLAQLTFLQPAIPVINNVDVAIVNDPAAIKEALVRQAASPVRWVETVQKMAASGITRVVECGPGKVLTGLVKRIDGNLMADAIVDQASLDAMLEATK
jgi:hypothetical protein